MKPGFILNLQAQKRTPQMYYIFAFYSWHTSTQTTNVSHYKSSKSYKVHYLSNCFHSTMGRVSYLYGFIQGNKLTETFIIEALLTNTLNPCLQLTGTECTRLATAQRHASCVGRGCTWSAIDLELLRHYYRRQTSLLGTQSSIAPVSIRSHFCFQEPCSTWR